MTLRLKKKIIYTILIETVNLLTFKKVNRNKSSYQISYLFGYQVNLIKCNFLIIKNIVWYDNILPQLYHLKSQIISQTNSLFYSHVKN